MVLPATWNAALLLLIVSALCFVIWPNLFKMVGVKWRYELFALDFALGSLTLALLAAYTLGSRGSELDFSDSMLVAGRRSEVVAMGAGAAFALGNLLYLGTIALMGLSNATLLTFSVFGCAVGLLHLSNGRYLPFGIAFVAFATAAAFTYISAKAAREASALRGAGDLPLNRPYPNRAVRAVPFTTKGTVTGILAGVSFGAVWPVLATAQTSKFGIGAYGGVLMAALGILLATFFLNFFLMSISLEGGSVGYSNYLAGSGGNHVVGALSGAVWTAGALALYTANTGSAGVAPWQAWSVPFAAALLSVITGVVFWQKMQLPGRSIVSKSVAVILFAAGTAVFLNALRS